jgi:hypothetical protein
MQQKLILVKEGRDFVYTVYIYVFLFFIFMLNMVFSTEEVLVSIGLFLFLNFIFLSLRAFFIKFIEDNNRTFYEDLFNPVRAVQANADRVLGYYNLEFKLWLACYSVLKAKVFDELESFYKIENGLVKGELLLMHRLKRSVINFVRVYYYSFYFSFMKYNLNVHLYRIFNQWFDNSRSLALFVENFSWVLVLSSELNKISLLHGVKSVEVSYFQSFVDIFSAGVAQTVLNSFLKDVKGE